MTHLEDLAQSYRVAFLRYLSRRDESALHLGYTLGRAAVADGLSILDLAHVHHEALLAALHDPSDRDVAAVAIAASEFFLEVIATYDMAQRGAGDDERR